MAENCKCELLSQVFIGGYVLKGLSAQDIELIINRCSVVKCKHVFKRQKVAGFCLVHFKKNADAADFFKLYSCMRNSLCKNLPNIYINAATFNGIKANYDLSTIQTRLTPTGTLCRCAPTTARDYPANPTTSGDQISPTTSDDQINPTTSNDQSNPITGNNQNSPTTIRCNNQSDSTTTPLFRKMVFPFLFLEDRRGHSPLCYRRTPSRKGSNNLHKYAKVMINRCSVVKCKHIYKHQKVAGFCLVHFKDAADAADFFKTYSCKRNSLCKNLPNIYINPATFNGIKANYDLSTIQTRLTPTGILYRCTPTTTSNDNPTTIGNINPTTTICNGIPTTTTITRNTTQDNKDTVF